MARFAQQFKRFGVLWAGALLFLIAVAMGNAQLLKAAFSLKPTCVALNDTDEAYRSKAAKPSC